MEPEDPNSPIRYALGERRIDRSHLIIRQRDGDGDGDGDGEISAAAARGGGG
jgi:hypothetical protein